VQQRRRQQVGMRLPGVQQAPQHAHAVLALGAPHPPVQRGQLRR